MLWNQFYKEKGQLCSSIILFMRQSMDEIIYLARGMDFSRHQSIIKKNVVRASREIYKNVFDLCERCGYYSNNYCIY